MNPATPRPDHTPPAPDGLRDALAELMQIGLGVARMVGQAAAAEAAFAASASQARPAQEFAPLAGSLAEAIEADAAAAAAAEARQTMVARAEAIGATFARVSRSLRLMALLIERLDRGAALRTVADDRHAMARRQIARVVTDAIANEAGGERAQALAEALADRLERLDTEAGIGDRPTDEIIRDICQGLGLDPARLTAATRAPGAPGPVGPEAGAAWQSRPPQRRPDG